MKQIIPASGNNRIKYFDCATNGKCNHTSTWHEIIIGYLILTDDDLPEDAEENFYVRPITNLDAMQHVQSYGGVHCSIVNNDGVDETDLTEIH